MDASHITDYLYVSRRLRERDIEAFQQLDVRLIISMIAHIRPPKAIQEMPLEVLWLRTFDFFLLPIPVKKLDRGVEVALPVIRDGHKVLVFCEMGKHRSVAMASAILIGMGYTADEAMSLVDDRRDVADPWAGHIQRQVRKFESYWNGKEIR